MKINSGINILGGLPDWNLLSVFLRESLESMRNSGGVHTFTAIKTDKSVKRFENAISATLIKFLNPEIEALVRDSMISEGLSRDSLLLLFWNASFNNELLHYLNEHTFFASFYSGRISIKQDEVFACLKELSETESKLKEWSDSTLNVTASKYLTLLKKFNLMEGLHNKTILHPELPPLAFRVIFERLSDWTSRIIS